MGDSITKLTRLRALGVMLGWSPHSIVGVAGSAEETLCGNAQITGLETLLRPQACGVTTNYLGRYR